MAADAPTLPPPFDREAVARGLARWEEETGAPVVPAHRPGLETIFGNSPYLTGLALREPQTMICLLDEGPDAAFGAAMDRLAAAEPEAPRAQLAETLRTAKRRAALAIGFADITGRWPLERVTGALSAFADAALQAAVAHLLREAHGRGELRLRWPEEPARGSGLIVLGMGKLGARELNYSSDIDLIVLFDPDSGAYHGENPLAFFVRIARDLVRLMEERTPGGYVFRTDLRLRPDPAATPLAVSVEAALTYYGALGQNWERAAMIKARPVAGDLAAGASFLAELRPFVWRKNLDFAAIRDVHSIKRQIQAHRGGATIAVAGHNLKLGRGGIREIEFFVQTQQLIWGGRDPALREPATLRALAALTRVGLVAEGTRAELEAAYRFLRRIEHRLQMIDDRQTHTVPADPEGLARLAAFAGFASVEAFAAELTRHLSRVERHYAALFEEAPELGGPGSLVFTGVEDDPETIATLRRMGYANPSGVAATVRGWHHGRPRATRSARAREILTELMPALLAAFARQREPDQAFARFDAFITRLPAGVQLFSLFQRNPALMDRVAAICGAAPLLADYLARHPPVLDGLLDGARPDRPVTPVLRSLLAEARHLEEAMDVVRRVVHERNFLIGVATLEGVLDVDRAGLARARLADAALTALLPRVVRDFAARYGRIAGGAMAVVAMGKLGGREMMAASDLDLILLYEHAPGAEAAKGGTGRRLSPPEYFARLAQQFVTAITAPTGEGKLFDVDMRLRPSGNKGPIAVQLAGFARYQAEEAWTWEHMALTRARVIAGPAGLRRRAAEAIRAALTRPRDPGKLREDAASLRTRIAKEIPPFSPWDVKYRPGGLLEAEFVCQVLQLIHAARTPQVLAGSTAASLRALAKAGALDADETARLIAASRLFRTVQGVLRLTVGKPRTAEDIPPPVVEALCRAAATAGVRDAVDLAALGAQMLACARDVRAAFNRHVADLGPVEAGPEA
jgi:glutamate-ammonia-ligase adenylyltransferase